MKCLLYLFTLKIFETLTSLFYSIVQSKVKITKPKARLAQLLLVFISEMSYGQKPFNGFRCFQFLNILLIRLLDQLSRLGGEGYEQEH